MSTTTTNYSLTKPAVNDPTDEDLWGTELNTDLDSIDTYLKLGIDHIKANISGTTSIDNTYRNKIVLCDATAAAFTVNLQAAATAGDGFTVTIKKTDSTGNVVTIDGNASETIDGATTQALNSQYDTYTITCDGSNWQIKGNKTTPTAVADASTTVKGILELATNAMTLAGTDALTAVTPASLASLATAAAAGKLVIGTLTIQFGTSAAASSPTITFGTAFSVAPYAVVACGATSSNASVVHVLTKSTTQFTTYTGNSSGATSLAFDWIAIGKT